MRRRLLIGAIGGDAQKASALAFGAAAARAGVIVLTGGGDRCDDEVKNAVIEGARTNGEAGRYIGILPGTSDPGGKAVWDRRANGLLLHTALPHFVRNLINGVTPDVLVAFGGSRGTLAEVAFALAAGKPLFFYGNGSKGSAVPRLRRNFKECFERDDEDNVRTFLAEPLRVWPAIAGKAWTADDLLQLLEHRLGLVEDWDKSVDALVGQCIAAATMNGPLGSIGPTGFPGLPTDPESKQRFEREIEAISE
jgi:uncharacterized protein (TIGR00725 family)